VDIFFAVGHRSAESCFTAAIAQPLYCIACNFSPYFPLRRPPGGGCRPSSQIAVREQLKVVEATTFLTSVKLGEAAMIHESLQLMNKLDASTLVGA
jgi:hypothetical protein